MEKKQLYKVSFAFLAIIITFGLLGMPGLAASAQSGSPEPESPQIEVISPYYSIQYHTLPDGKQISRETINSPSAPLPEYQEEREASKIKDTSKGTIANFPSYDWVYRCSAVSAAMIAAYYDRGDYPNIYTGPTNNGLMPQTDTSWPFWYDSNNVSYPSNPLIASRLGTDGRTTRGSINDYWVSYQHAGPDPYVTGGWPEHQWTDAIGDFMKTSQAAYNNVDGATSFYNWSTGPNPLTCAEMEDNNIADDDGTYGRKLFYEARGYTVSDCYSQRTDNNQSGGFTFAKFKSEIDAGHPVFLNLEGHSVVGYGYSGNTIYIRDTWDSNPGNVYSMSWGGSYQGMALRSVSIVHLEPAGPDNQAPVAQNQAITTAEDTAKEITLVASDPDGDTLTYSIVAQPQHGSLSAVSGNKVTYTPALNYFGSDSFTFKANDSMLDSNTATVSITVTAVNDPPVAQNQAVNTAEDTAKEITLVASDPDGDTLTYSIVAQPQHGSLSAVSGNKVTYTPALNYFGQDSFTFKANDSTLDSNTATVSITVTAVNDPPVAQNQAVTTAEDTAKEITLIATDVDSTTLTYSIVAQPQHGSLSAVSGNKVTYTPALNYFGSDSFTFKANDSTLDSNTATVSITVTAVNDPPVAQNQAVTTAEDTAKEITLVATDVDSTTLTYSIVAQPQHGSLSALSGNKLTYTPDENYNGSDSFTFRASDGALNSNIATVTINVEPVNDAPVAFDQSLLAIAGEMIEIELEALDVDGDILEFIIVEEPLHGSFELAGKILKYTPDSAFSGVDKFVFKVNDGSLDSNLATVTITVSRTEYHLFLPYITR